jgi:hypothetical protein
MYLAWLDTSQLSDHGTLTSDTSPPIGFPHHTAEHALAHRISDKAESAYRCGDELERRRLLMEAWATWCEPKRGAKVVPFRAG